jgi:hypothetical protein
MEWVAMGLGALFVLLGSAPSDNRMSEDRMKGLMLIGAAMIFVPLLLAVLV